MDRPASYLWAILTKLAQLDFSAVYTRNDLRKSK